jgi:hypothetical protein
MTASGVAKVGGSQSEYRIYSWKGNFASFEHSGSRELSGLGYVHEVNKPRFDKFHDSDGVVVEFDASETVADPNCRPARPDPNWITVTVGRMLPDNLLTEIRLALMTCKE